MAGFKRNYRCAWTADFLRIHNVVCWRASDLAVIDIEVTAFADGRSGPWSLMADASATRPWSSRHRHARVARTQWRRSGTAAAFDKRWYVSAHWDCGVSSAEREAACACSVWHHSPASWTELCGASSNAPRGRDCRLQHVPRMLRFPWEWAAMGFRYHGVGGDASASRPTDDTHR
jgi:hypothetical protein